MTHRNTIFNYKINYYKIVEITSNIYFTRSSQCHNNTRSLFPNHLPKCICCIWHWTLCSNVFAFWIRISLIIITKNLKIYLFLLLLYTYDYTCIDIIIISTVCKLNASMIIFKKKE